MIDSAFSADGRFFKGNLHTHSKRSDGAKDPEEVCRLYRQAGYDFVVLTDHFMAQYGFPIVDTTPFRTTDFTTILGAEVHAPATHLGELWHILSVGLPLDFAGNANGETGPELARRCLAAGAFVAIAHPGRSGLDMTDAATISDVHAVEIYNHGSLEGTSRADSTLFADQLLNLGRRITLLAADDAHNIESDCFGGFVMVKAPALDPDLLLAGLKAGHYYASQGPQLHHIRYDDDFVEVACSPASAIMILGRGSAISRQAGYNITGARLPLGPVRAGTYARVVVVDGYGRKAWSNPLWL